MLTLEILGRCKRSFVFSEINNILQVFLIEVFSS